MSLTIAELQVRLDHLEKASHTPYFYDLTHRLLTAAWSSGQLPGFSQGDILNIAGAARLHDLGKLSVPEVILDKTGSLTVEETSLMENHAEYGKQVLDALSPWAPPAPHSSSMPVRSACTTMSGGPELVTWIICTGRRFPAMSKSSVSRTVMTRCGPAAVTGQQCPMSLRNT